MFVLEKNQELKKALKIIWIISALFFLIILFIIFFVPEEIFLSKIPICENKNNNLECFFCGSTRAFFEIKKMNFANAYALNKGSIPLFLILTINFTTFAIYSIFKKIKL